MSLKTRVAQISRILLKTVISLILVSFFAVIVFRFIPVPFTPLMFIRAGEQYFSGKKVRMEKDWVGIENISLNTRLAVVVSEDQNFLNHRGFDLEAIKKAVHHNKKHKRKRGASTISQQTAKNLFLWPSRSWVRKGFEVYFTGLIELIWSKERILEVYLNILEMGDGIYGVEAASRAYFNKPAKNLSPQQSAVLAAVIPNPRRYSAIRPGPYLKKRQLWILNQMRLNERLFLLHQ